MVNQSNIPTEEFPRTNFKFLWWNSSRSHGQKKAGYIAKWDGFRERERIGIIVSGSLLIDIQSLRLFGSALRAITSCIRALKTHSKELIQNLSRWMTWQG